MVLPTINSDETMMETTDSAANLCRKTHSPSPSNVVLADTPPNNIDGSCDPQVRLGLCEPLCTSFKPFFIMDWLDEVEPEALQQAQKILGSKRNKGYLSENHQDRLHSSSARTGVSVSKNNPNLLEDSFHERSITIGNGYNAKGIQKARQGIWSEALSCWESALQVRQQVLGKEHLDVANTQNNIGIALGKLKRFDDALQHLERALAIRTVHYGDKHQEIAATLHNTGNVYQQAGDLSNALQCFSQCKTIQEQIHKGLDHAEVARACIAIGHCYWEAESAFDAREAYMDALAIFQRIGRPENDPEVQTTVDDIYDLDQRILREAASSQ